MADVGEEPGQPFLRRDARGFRFMSVVDDRADDLGFGCGKEPLKLARGDGHRGSPGMKKPGSRWRPGGNGNGASRAPLHVQNADCLCLRLLGNHLFYAGVSGRELAREF